MNALFVQKHNSYDLKSLNKLKFALQRNECDL